MSTWARSARRCSVAATACAVTPPMPASISSKTSVSPPATAASARATRESSPPEAVSAIGANGRPAFGRMRNVASSRPSRRPRARGARRGTRPLPSRATRARPRRPRRVAARSRRAPARSASARAVIRSSACSTACLAASTGSPPSAEAPSSALRGGRELEELVVRRRREAAPEVGDRLQPLLDALERARLRVERRDEAVEVAAGLAQPHGEVAQLLRGRAELGRDALERRERALREGGERRRALALVGRDRRGGGVRRLGELLDVAEALAPREQLLLVARAPCPRSRRRAPAAPRDATRPRPRRA